MAAIRVALESAPPEISSDIVDRGIVLTGGASMLKNLDSVIAEKTLLAGFYSCQPFVLCSLRSW